MSIQSGLMPKPIAIPSSAELEGLAAPSFHADAAAALGELRAALSAVIRAIPDGPLRARDLQRTLRIDYKLAWSIFKIAAAPDPLAVGIYVPGKAPMSKVLRAAASKGASDVAVRRAQTAFDNFEVLVERHAGDRASFDSMIADLAGEDTEALDLTTKRAVFRGNGHLWGVQTRSRFVCDICHPAEAGDGIDAVTLEGFLGLKQLRTNQTMRVAIRHKMTRRDKPSEIARDAKYFPLEPAHVLGDGPASLLADFCEHPLPEFRTFVDESDFTTTELLSRGLGNTAAFAFAVGSVIRRWGDRRIPRLSSVMRVPAEVYVQDVVVHEDLWAGPAPTVRIYAPTMPGDITTWKFREEDLLPVQESISEVGRGIDSLDTPDVPHYPEMARHALAKVGWDPARFRVFRCRIEYPVLFSIVRIEFPSSPST